MSDMVNCGARKNYSIFIFLWVCRLLLLHFFFLYTKIHLKAFHAFNARAHTHTTRESMKCIIYTHYIIWKIITTFFFFLNFSLSFIITKSVSISIGAHKTIRRSASMKKKIYSFFDDKNLLDYCCCFFFYSPDWLC